MYVRRVAMSTTPRRAILRMASPQAHHSRNYPRIGRVLSADSARRFSRRNNPICCGVFVQNRHLSAY